MTRDEQRAVWDFIEVTKQELHYADRRALLFWITGWICGGMIGYSIAGTMAGCWP